MRVILCTLMAVWLLAVTTLGWCCQPACAMGKCSHQQISSKQTQKKCGCGCGCQTHSPITEVAANCSCEPNCHGVCTYVLTSKVQIDSHWILSLFEVPGQVVDQDQLVTTQTAAWAKSHALAVLQPPLRRHLALQIILI